MIFRKKKVYQISLRHERTGKLKSWMHTVTADEKTTVAFNVDPWTTIYIRRIK